MSGRRSRQVREGRAWLAAAPACLCGPGLGHGPDCPQLRYIAADRNRCGLCGRRYQQKQGKGWRIFRCRLGHTHGSEIRMGGVAR